MDGIAPAGGEIALASADAKPMQTASPPTATAAPPMSPISNVKRFGKWVLSFALPGIGMFQEAYFIFSVGNLKPIWAEQYPDCWQVTRYDPCMQY